MRSIFRRTHSKQIALNLGVNINQVEARAAVLGLRKDADILGELRRRFYTPQSIARENMHVPDRPYMSEAAAMRGVVYEDVKLTPGTPINGNAYARLMAWRAHESTGRQHHDC